MGRSVERDDMIGMFGENTCNTSGNRLIVCNGRKLVSEREWTRGVRSSLK